MLSGNHLGQEISIQQYRSRSAYQRIVFLLLRQAKLRRTLRSENGYDIIVDTFNGWDLPSGIAGRKIVYFHEIPFLNRPPGRLRDAYYALGEDVFRRHMTKIRDANALCNSSYTRQTFVRGLRNRRSSCIPPRERGILQPSCSK